MRIAQVAPLYESVPPRLYGGTERVVSYLTEELVKKGHEVTLFASGDSKTSARLIAPIERGLRLSDSPMDGSSAHLIMLDQIMKMQEQFDVIHFHIEGYQFPLIKYLKVPNITTLHGRLDHKWTHKVFSHFHGTRLTSISNDQRRPLDSQVSRIRWHGNVYHGLPSELLMPVEKKENYLAFLGRISPEKGVEYAIEIALRANMHLKIAAKIDDVDRDYFNQRIKPLIDKNPKNIEFLGEVDDNKKQLFLGRAKALLFPIQWPEPFGLVMIEAMACDTPVIAFKNGSVPEVIIPGKNGFIVHNIHEAIGALEMLTTIKRGQCRQVFEQHFMANIMTGNYVQLYHKLIFEKYQPTLKENELGYTKQIRLPEKINDGALANTWQ